MIIRIEIWYLGSDEAGLQETEARQSKYSLFHGIAIDATHATANQPQ